MTEPALRPIRAILPNLGGIDISPVILIIGLMFLRVLIHRSISLYSARWPSSLDHGEPRRQASASSCGSHRRGVDDAIDGIENLADGRTALKVRVRAAPSRDGEANAALVRVIAEALRVPAPAGRSRAAGASARIKRVQVNGDPPLRRLPWKTCAPALPKLAVLRPWPRGSSTEKRSQRTCAARSPTQCTG